MDRKTKIYTLIGPVLASFIFSMTSPTIQIYFMQMVSQEVLAISNMLSVGLAAIVNTTVTNDKAKELYRNHFMTIVIVDVLCFIAISYGSLLDVSVRFLGLAVLSAISSTLWFTAMSNAINRIVSGDKLTDWNAFSKSMELYASLLGGLIAVFVTGFSVEICIALQCLSNLFMGITDLKAFSLLKKAG